MFVMTGMEKNPAWKLEALTKIQQKNGMMKMIKLMKDSQYVISLNLVQLRVTL